MSAPILSSAIFLSSRISLNAEPDFFRHGFRFRGKDARRQLVRRLINEIAREVLRFTEHPAVIDGRGEVRAQSGSQIQRVQPD